MPQYTIQCIESLLQFAGNLNCEIIVVDNNSEDNSRRQITSKFPAITYLEMTENVGFSRANNAGLNVSKGEYILFLNNDTIFIEDILTKLIAVMNEDKNITASCVQLYYEDKTRQLSGSNFVFAGFNMLLTLPYLKEIVSWFAGLFKIKKPHPEKTIGIEEVDWISGAFMMVRKESIKAAGAFDEDFFLFSEETEWCYRLKKTGKIVICPELSIIHIGGKTMQNVLQANEDNYFPLWEKKGLQLMLSHLLRIKKQYGSLLMLIHFHIYLSEISFFFIGVLISKIVNKNNRTFSEAVNYSKNVLRLIKFIPSILLNKHQLYKAY